MDCPAKEMNGCDHELTELDFVLRVQSHEVYVEYRCPRCGVFTGFGFDGDDLKAGLT